MDETNSQIDSFLVDMVHTKEDVSILKNEIDLLLSSLYKKDDLDKVLNEQVRGSTASFFPKEIATMDRPQIESQLKLLQKRIFNLEEFSLTLAHEPTHAFLTELTGIIRGVLGNLIVLDITVNPRIVGGAVVSYRGKFLDYSLKHKLKLMLTTQK